MNRLLAEWKRWRFIVSNLLTEPTVTLHMRVDNEDGLNLEGDGWLHHYELFSKPHPKYRIIGNKTLGVALLPVPDNFEAYYQSVNGKNSAAYYARKAERNGYTIKEIDRNAHIDDILEIQTSTPFRQGRPIPAGFSVRKEHYQPMPNYHYWGVLDHSGRLVGYAWVAYYNETVMVSGLLGHAERLNDGVMYFLMLHVVKHCFDERQKGNPLRFIMYDSFLGATSGMVMFKRKLGFAPYRVRWMP